MLEKNANKNRLRSRTSIAAVAAMFLLSCFCAGCGASLKYKLPPGKTLVYRIYTVAGRDVKDKKPRLKSTGQELEIKAKVLDKIAGKYTIYLTAGMPAGKKNPAAVGEILGSLNIKMDESGRVSESTGMGIPVELRLLFPQLPPGKAGKRDKWTEDFRRDVVPGSRTKLKMTYGYKGRAIVGGRQCVCIHGAAKFKRSNQKVNLQEGLDVKMTIDYKYDQDFCISREGYPLKMGVAESRRIVMRNNLTRETVVDSKDIFFTDLIFTRLE